MAELMDFLRRFLFGAPVGARAAAVPLLGTTIQGELHATNDVELMLVVFRILGDPSFRAALRGNVRFMESVGRQYDKRGTITPRQRTAVIRILERAYPHNLAAILATSRR
jgi:hypothetical protein